MKRALTLHLLALLLEDPSFMEDVEPFDGLTRRLGRALAVGHVGDYFCLARVCV